MKSYNVKVVLTLPLAMQILLLSLSSSLAFSSTSTFVHSDNEEEQQHNFLRGVVGGNITDDNRIRHRELPGLPDDGNDGIIPDPDMEDFIPEQKPRKIAMFLAREDGHARYTITRSRAKLKDVKTGEELDVKTIENNLLWNEGRFGHWYEFHTTRQRVKIVMKTWIQGGETHSTTKVLDIYPGGPHDDVQICWVVGGTTTTSNQPRITYNQNHYNGIIVWEGSNGEWDQFQGNDNVYSPYGEEWNDKKPHCGYYKDLMTISNS